MPALSTVDMVIQPLVSNPPFELSDSTRPRYITLLNNVLQSTLYEYSEFVPMLREKIFQPIGVMTDLYLDIDESFMDFVILCPYDSVNKYMMSAFADVGYNYPGLTNLSYEVAPYSIIDIASRTDALNIIEEWFSTHLTYMIYDGRNVKLDPNVEWFALYKAYRESSDLYNTDLVKFKQLYEINLLLALYQSDIFASEGGIRSVSLSGLSVSFNVPNAETYITKLTERKAELFKLLNDYDIETF